MWLLAGRGMEDGSDASGCGEGVARRDDGENIIGFLDQIGISGKEVNGSGARSAKCVGAATVVLVRCDKRRG